MFYIFIKVLGFQKKKEQKGLYYKILSQPAEQN